MQIEASVAIFVLSLGLGVLQAGVLTKVELLLSLILAVSIHWGLVFKGKAEFAEVRLRDIYFSLWHMSLYHAVIEEKLEKIEQIELSTKHMGLRMMWMNFQGSDLVKMLNQLFCRFVRSERHKTFYFIRLLSFEIGVFRQSLRLRGFEVSLEVVI